MQILENISLNPYNTFGITSLARQFAVLVHRDQLPQLSANAFFSTPSTRLILGGGSNVLFTRNIDGIVVKNELKGIEQIAEDDDFVYVRAGAGEPWHPFVLHCIEKGFGGIENLSLIPGNVGASPMQNIGAYGVEIKDVFHELEAWHIADREVVRFGLNDCRFGYRESVFKGNMKNQFVILSVTFRLRKKPVLNTSYGAIGSELEKMGLKSLTLQAVSQAVINIRRAKLPDPAVIGNAGSFFKNPQVPAATFLELQQQYPNVVGYPAGEGFVKMAAGWLIEQCGWKGFREGDAGCHSKQALVLVNYGNASGAEVYALSTRIIHSVHEKFGVMLEREVNII